MADDPAPRFARQSRRRRSLSLRTAIIVYVLLPMVALIAFCGYIALYSIEARVTHRLQEDIELIARAIRLPVNDALLHDRRDAVQQALESAFRIGRVYGAYVYDASGKQIAAAGIGERGIDRKGAASLAAGNDRRGGFGTAGARKVYSYFIPLVDPGGRIIGLLQVTRRASDFSLYMGWIRLIGLGALVLITLVLVAVVMWGYYGAIGRHLATFARGMARIGSGDRAHRMPLEGPLELVRLGADVNAMVDGLLRSEVKIVRQEAAQQALEERLAESEKMAAIGRLAAGIAHELGSPLSVVDGTAQRLLRRRDAPAAERESLNGIRAAVRRMETIVRQLMDLGRNSTVQRHRCRAGRLARAAVARLRPEFDSSAVNLELHDRTAGSEMVLADAPRIERALASILRNALQASPRGRVRFTWEMAGDAVVFRVEDDGPGIADDLRSRLFEPFFTTKAVGQGTGLGLALAHACAREHGGRVEIGEAALGGALVQLVLPRAKSEELEPEHVRADNDTAGGVAPRAGVAGGG